MSTPQAPSASISGAAPDATTIPVVEIAPEPEQDEVPAYVPRRTLAQDYLDAIDRLEAEEGPYASELSDLYLGLGQTYLDTGEYEQARDAFNRGVMAVRVNAGPNSPEQTNHLYLIANIETMLGNRDVADQVMHNIYFVNSQYYGEDSLEMLPVLDRIYDWYVLTWPVTPAKPKFGDYEKMLDLMESVVSVYEANYGEGDPRTAKAYRQLGDAEYQLARYIMNDELVAAITSEIQMVRFSDGTAESDHYDAGRRAYRKCLEAMAADPNTNPLELAEALANQADWYLVFGRGARARKMYEEAWQAIAQDGENAQAADDFLGKPRPMHFVEPLFAYLEDLPPELEELDLDVSLTVTRHGDVRYVEVKNPSDLLSKQQLDAIERQVRETPFRPAMKAGECVTTEEFIQQFAVAPYVATS